MKILNVQFGRQLFPYKGEKGEVTTLRFTHKAREQRSQDSGELVVAELHTPKDPETCENKAVAIQIAP